MDIKKTAREIGLFETAINLAPMSKSSCIHQKVGGSMPLPDENIKERTHDAAEWLLSLGKQRYMFLNPEIALIEQLRSESNKSIDVIITIPCDLDQDSRERIEQNLPRGIEVTVLNEPYFPQSFFPGNGLIVLTGYLGNNRAMVLPDTYRMAEHYSGFLGKKVLVPYTELETGTRYDGWMEIREDMLNAKWRMRHE